MSTRKLLLCTGCILVSRSTPFTNPTRLCSGTGATSSLVGRAADCGRRYPPSPRSTTSPDRSGGRTIAGPPLDTTSPEGRLLAARRRRWRGRRNGLHDYGIECMKQTIADEKSRTEYLQFKPHRGRAPPAALTECLGPGLVDEDQARVLSAADISSTSAAVARRQGDPARRRARFFLKLMPCRRKNRHSVSQATTMPRCPTRRAAHAASDRVSRQAAQAAIPARPPAR